MGTGREHDYTTAVLCIDAGVARGTHGTMGNVKVVVGRHTKDELLAKGLIPLGRHPEPLHPGEMTISDPAVDATNEKIRSTKERNVARTRAASGPTKPAKEPAQQEAP